MRKWLAVYELTLPDEVESPGYQLLFSSRPDAVDVICYEEGKEGIRVPVHDREEGFYLSDLRAGSLYQINARWENGTYANGTVSYGFRAI